MSTTPQATPTADDLAREQYYASIAATTPPPATYKGRARGKTKDSSWRTNIALWESYPALPVAPLAKGDKPAADAWLRIEAMVVQKMFEEKPGSQAPGWNPDKVTWPLPTPPASWSAGSKFAARRPWKKDVPQTRNHTGIDLAASPGTPVLAPESGTIVAPNTGWEYDKVTKKGVKALIMQTDSGLTILLGGVRPNSAIDKTGQKVQAGEKLAEIGRYPLGDSMLHFTLHNDVLSEAEVNARKSWPAGQPPPANVIDPASYLGAAANNPKYSTVGFVPGVDGPGLVENDVQGGEIFEGVEPDALPFVSASDGRTGAKPCVGEECVKADALAWWNAVAAYRKAAQPLVEYTMKVIATGVVATSAVLTALQSLKDADYFIKQNTDAKTKQLAANWPGMNTWPTIAQECLSLSFEIRTAIDVLTAFVSSASSPGTEKAPDAQNPPVKPNPPPPAEPSAGGSSTGIIIGIGAAMVIAAVAVISLSARKKTRAAAALLLLALPGCGPQPPMDTDAETGGLETSGSTVVASTSTSTSTDTSTTGSSSSNTSSPSSDATGTTGPVQCTCTANEQCPSGLCDLVQGVCGTPCDPTCELTCQTGWPGLCEPPCDVPCPNLCTPDGVCPVCPTGIDTMGGASAAPTTG